MDQVKDQFRNKWQKEMMLSDSSRKIRAIFDGKTMTKIDLTDKMLKPISRSTKFHQRQAINNVLKMST